MIPVTAPEGIEAVRYFRDRPHGAGGWIVSARVAGDQWWTDLGDIGNPYLTDAELDSRAAARVVCPRLGFAPAREVQP